MSLSRLDVLRPLREDDAEAVAELFAAAFGDARALDAEEIRTWFRNPELDAGHLRVLERDGRVIGYGDIWIQGQELALDAAAPGCWEPFLDWAESAGREANVRDVRVGLPAGHELEALVRERGYRLGRSSFTMEVELTEPADPHEPAAGIELRSYRPADLTDVRTAINEAFAHDWHHHDVSESNFREFYVNARGADPMLWTLAWDGPELAGFVLAYSEHAGDTTLGWIGTLGVRPAWRRRGLGRLLLLAAFAGLGERGLRRVGLGVDTENEFGALRLYERAGMRPVQRFDNWVVTL